MKESKRRLRRGSAMPMAIAVLLMLTAFSILILSTTMLEARQAGRRDRLLRERLAVDAAAESYIAEVLKNATAKDEWANTTGFDVKDPINEGNNVRVTLTKNGKECLKITLSKNDSTYTILAWEYQ